MGIGILLFAAIAGYVVLERAQTHKGGMLKPVGQFVGWFTILYAVAAALVALQGDGGWCGDKKTMRMGKMCPWHGRASQNAPSTSAVAPDAP